jgi:hypothetical protein
VSGDIITFVPLTTGAMYTTAFPSASSSSSISSAATPPPCYVPPTLAALSLASLHVSRSYNDIYQELNLSLSTKIYHDNPKQIHDVNAIIGILRDGYGVQSFRVWSAYIDKRDEHALDTLKYFAKGRHVGFDVFVVVFWATCTPIHLCANPNPWRFVVALLWGVVYDDCRPCSTNTLVRCPIQKHQWAFCRVALDSGWIPFDDVVCL